MNMHEYYLLLCVYTHIHIYVHLFIMQPNIVCEYKRREIVFFS